jgi:hypothetical protein
MKSSQLAQIFVLVFSSSSIHRIFGHEGDDEETTIGCGGAALGQTPTPSPQ